MNKLRHFVTWEITREDLKEIVRVVEEDVVVSFPINDDVELVLRKKGEPE